MPSPAFHERRKHKRAGIRMEAILEGGSPGKNVRLTVLNFSVGGFFCESSRKITPMTCLGITFSFPPFAEHPTRVIEGRAVVVRCQKPVAPAKAYRVAACFTELSAEARTHIQEYVDWYGLVHGAAETGAREAA